MSMVNRRGTTAKCKIPELLYEETKFTFQRNISTKVREFNIPPSLVLNLDQTPLSYVTCEKYTFEALGSKTVPIASSKTKQYLPKYTFPKDFEVIFNVKHWANESTAISFYREHHSAVC